MWVWPKPRDWSAGLTGVSLDPGSAKEPVSNNNVHSERAGHPKSSGFRTYTLHTHNQPTKQKGGREEGERKGRRRKE